jgi:arylsulfatase A-like enzyme
MRSELGRRAAIVALLVVTACGRGAAGERPRNAILISIDTLRSDFLSCYGHPRETSPNLDRLARSGVRFTDVTAAAPWTLPSHATMLTGLYPSHHGVKSHETRLPASVATLAEDCLAAGFQTLAVVNTHNIGAPQFQLDQGFERFEYVSEIETDPRTKRPRTPNTGPKVLEEARAQLASRDRARPFFLFLHVYDVHTDFTPRADLKERFVQPYAGKITARSQQLNGVRNRGERLTEADLRFLREMYEAEIRQLDELLGEFLGWLASAALLDGTLVVVTSDHGEEFQEHGGLLHGRTEYQEVMRVPLIFAGAGVPAGRVIDTPVHGIDLTPTLLALLGVPSSMARDGLDLSALWRGGTLPARTFFAEADHNNRIGREYVTDIKKMVRRGEEKLLFDTHTQACELYDLARDPLEREDRARAEPERVAALRAELERYLAGTRASEAIAPPTEAEQSMLDALGYGGDTEEDGAADARANGTAEKRPDEKQHR